MKRLLYLAFTSLVTLPVWSQQIAKGLTASNGVYIGFYEYKPSNYSTNTSVKYPLIVFLHGLGERGNGTTDLPKLLNQAIPNYIKNGNTMTFTWNGKTETFLVLSPQLPTSYTAWPTIYAEEMIKYAKKNLRVDTNRIFVTGFSMGGTGTWYYASTALSRASQLAGIVPICGGCSIHDACNMAKGKTAVWAFHATDDLSISPSCTINGVKGINNCNPVIPAVMTLYTSGDHFIWNRAYSFDYSWQNPNLWEWMLNENRALPANKKPVVRAGNDLSTTTAVARVNVSAAGSSDPDGTLLRYVWRKISGPAFGSLSPAVSSNGAATVTGLTVAGTYVYELKGIDNRASWALDTVKITVTGNSTITKSQYPTARAGADSTITLPKNSVTLDGRWSSDADGSVTGFSWSKVSGPSSYSIASPTSSKTLVTNLVSGTYNFRLVVTDNAGLKDDDTVKVVVNGTSTTPVGNNLPPVARAGADITITLPVNYSTLDGKWSSDPEKQLSTFNWTKIAGPTQYTIANPNAAVSSVTNLVQGIYKFRLLVTDKGGLKDDDTVQVTVRSSTTTVVSPMAAVEEAQAATDTLMLMPNPVTSYLNINYASPGTGKIVVNIYDANGAILLTRTDVKTDIRYVQSIDVSNLLKGTYYIGIITEDGKRKTIKFIKQ